MKDREKELNYLIYLENENIKQSKKNIKHYREELDTLEKSRYGSSKKYVSKRKNKR